MRSAVTAYALAIAALVAAVLLRLLLDPLMGDALPLVTLFGAVAAAVWVGGYRPAVVVGILGYLACDYLFIEPRGRLSLDDLGKVVGLVAYLFTCALIIGFGEAMRIAQIRAEMLDRQVAQMARLVDDLLDMSRITRGKIELRKERIELASVLNQAVEGAPALYKSMNHELTVTLPPPSVYLNADPTRLAQVVGNLLNNACKFTDKGGHIWLTVERAGDKAVIRVRDTGIGIAAEDLPRLFEMFTQVDTSLERSRQGLGIGLTLVKTLVEMHDGTVEVHSDGLGHGSEFVVRLPILVETPKPLSGAIVSEPAPPLGHRILIVDDNEDGAESLSLLLKLDGHEIHIAHDGLEAVEAAERFRPDAVLLDIGLPKLNGYEVCRRIREQPWGKDLVLVAVTGWGQDEDRSRSNEAGFNAHIVKPVDHDALVELLASLPPGKNPS